jgi:DNA-binding phage protein
MKTETVFIIIAFLDSKKIIPAYLAEYFKEEDPTVFIAAVKQAVHTNKIHKLNRLLISRALHSK